MVERVSLTYIVWSICSAESVDRRSLIENEGSRHSTDKSHQLALLNRASVRTFHALAHNTDKSKFEHGLRGSRIMIRDFIGSCTTYPLSSFFLYPRASWFVSRALMDTVLNRSPVATSNYFYQASL